MQVRILSGAPVLEKVMKSFSQFIFETVIKLRGFDNQLNKKIQNFMQNLDDTSKRHPMNNNAKVIGDAHVHVSPMNGSIHIHDIKSYKQGSGAGTEALKHLTSLADKHKVNLHLNAQGYENTKSSQLKKWYKRHGFEHDSKNSSSMTRKFKET